MLSSGNISNVIGPNTSDAITVANSLPGDADLGALIPGYMTYDATILEFDFIPYSDVISFQYVFTSDEYNEWVNTAYNGVFGFFLNGVNVALLPSTSIAVSINNVNGGGTVAVSDGDKPHHHSFGFNIREVQNGLEVIMEYNSNHTGKASSKNGEESPLQIMIKGIVGNVVPITTYSGGVGAEFDAPCTVRTLTSDNERKLQMCHVRIVDNGEPGTGNKKKGTPADEFELTVTELMEDGSAGSRYNYFLQTWRQNI